MTLDSSLPIIRRYTSTYIDLLCCLQQTALARSPFNSSSEILTTARGHVNQSRSVYARRLRPYDGDDDVDGMGRMRVIHFSEIISDSFLSFSLSTHRHIRLDTARVLLMIDGAQQVTRVILRQVALNTPEPYRNLCVCAMLCLLYLP